MIFCIILKPPFVGFSVCTMFWFYGRCLHYNLFLRVFYCSCRCLPRPSFQRFRFIQSPCCNSLFSKGVFTCVYFLVHSLYVVIPSQSFVSSLSLAPSNFFVSCLSLSVHTIFASSSFPSSLVFITQNSPPQVSLLSAIVLLILILYHIADV